MWLIIASIKHLYPPSSPPNPTQPTPFLRSIMATITCLGLTAAWPKRTSKDDEAIAVAQQLSHLAYVYIWVNTASLYHLCIILSKCAHFITPFFQVEGKRTPNWHARQLECYESKWFHQLLLPAANKIDKVIERPLWTVVWIFRFNRDRYSTSSLAGLSRIFGAPRSHEIQVEYDIDPSRLES